MYGRVAEGIQCCRGVWEEVDDGKYDVAYLFCLLSWFISTSPVSDVVRETGEFESCTREADDEGNDVEGK